MQAKQEKWDLYDQQGRKTGKTIQAGENVPYGYCLYCVGIWVIDSEKKILLTKRSSQKRYAPGKWDLRPERPLIERGGEKYGEGDQGGCRGNLERTRI